MVDILIVAMIMGIFGGVLSSVLGFLEAEPAEPFIIRKFISAIVRAAISGIVVSVSFNVQQTPRDLVLLFLASVGADNVVNNATKILKQKNAAANPT